MRESTGISPLEDILWKLQLFHGIQAGTLREGAYRAKLMNAYRGATLVHRGARLPGIIVVLSGSLKLALRAPGREMRVLGIITPGQTFGEAFALLDRASPFDVAAVVDANIAALSLSWIRALMARELRFARNMANALAEQTVVFVAELEADALQRASQRLASYLASVAVPLAKRGRWRAELPFSKTLLAARLGMKKETLSRLFRQFTDDGVISVSQRDVSIFNRDRLVELVDAA